MRPLYYRKIIQNNANHDDDLRCSTRWWDIIARSPPWVPFPQLPTVGSQSHLHIHTHHHKYMELFWNITLHGAKHRWIEIGHNP